MFPDTNAKLAAISKNDLKWAVEDLVMQEQSIQ